MIDRLNVITNRSGIFHIYVYVPAGSIYEDEGSSGCSHLLEHMLFKNKGETYSSITKGLTEIGAHYNAATYKDVTYYYIKTHRDNYREAIRIMGQIINGLRFSEEDLRTERKVVIEEYNQTRDGYDGRFFDLANRSILHEDNVYGKSVIGNIHVLRNITAADLKDYARKRYKDVMVLVNVDVGVKGKAKRELARVFGAQRSFDVHDNAMLASANLIEPRLVFISRGFSQVTTRLSFLTFPASQIKDHIVLKFVQYCLTGAGIYSILNHELRELRGLVYTIHSYSEVFRYAGFYYIQLGSSSKKTDYIISMIIHTLSLLKRKGLPKKVLRYYRNSYLSTIRTRMLDEEYRTEYHGLSLFYDVKVAQEDVIKTIKGANNDTIMDVCNRAFDLGRMGVLSVGDYSSVDRMSDRVGDIIDTYARLDATS